MALNKIPEHMIDQNFVQKVTDVETSLAESTTQLEDLSLYNKFPKLALETDDSLRVQRMINYAQDNGIGKITLPARKFYCYSPLRISKPLTFEGVYNSRDRSSDGGVGTIIYDLTDINSTEPFLTVKPIDNTVFLRGMHLNNFNIVGNYQNHPCVYIERMASDGNLQNIMIEKYSQEGLMFGSCDDLNILNVFVCDCGGTDSNGYNHYALKIGDDNNYTVTNTANAFHLFGVHVESCRFAIYVGNSFFISFTNCKVEQSYPAGYLSKLGAHIYISQNAYDVTFTDCSFAPRGINDFLNLFPNTLIKDIPYFIQIDEFISYKQHRAFINCTFRSPSGDALKLMKGTGTTMLSHNTFGYLTEIVESIQLDKSIITGNKFMFTALSQNPNTAENMVNIGKGLNITNSIVMGNMFHHIYKPAPNYNDYAITGDGNTYRANTFEGWTNKYNGSTYKIDRSDVPFSMTDANIGLLYDPSSINYPSFVLDLNKINSKQIYFNMNENVTITSITGGTPGERLTIYNDQSTYTLKIQGGTGVNQVRFPTWAGLYNIKAADFIELEYVANAAGGYWHMVSEHVHNPTYTGNPNGSVVPNYAGQRILDATNNIWYISKGIGSNDWLRMSAGAMGSATISASASSVTVTHNLGVAPSVILVTPKSTNIGSVWISGITTTQFNINCSTPPASNTGVSWRADI